MEQHKKDRLIELLRLAIFFDEAYISQTNKNIEDDTKLIESVGDSPFQEKFKENIKNKQIEVAKVTEQLKLDQEILAELIEEKNKQ